jgi:hypothetical protein
MQNDGRLWCFQSEVFAEQRRKGVSVTILDGGLAQEQR